MVVLFLLSVLHQKEVVQSVALFLLKWLKWITSKLRHLERILVTVYYSNILNYFTFLLSFQQKKVFHIFAISDALVDPIWHKLSYQHKIWSLRMRKKKQDSNVHCCLLPRRCPLCQYNANTKVQKRSLYLSNFLN